MIYTTNSFDNWAYSDALTMRAVIEAERAPDMLTITRSGNRAVSIAIGRHTLTLAEVSHLGKACLEVLTAPEDK